MSKLNVTKYKMDNIACLGNSIILITMTFIVPMLVITNVLGMNHFTDELLGR